MYHGPTLNGTPSGSGGFCAYQDGSEYSGEFKSGRRNGVGRYVAPNHDVFEGKWVGDQRWKGKWQSSKGNEFYDGYWSGDRPHGAGSRLYADGTLIECEWADGRRVGIDLQATADLKQWA